MKHRLTALGVLAAVLSSGSITATADPNCRCRLYGEYFDIGSVMCIRGSLARCEMNQNNTSWKRIGEICPQARNIPSTTIASRLSLAQSKTTTE